ncbi:unnamed protein product [Adineta ricciae]|uniref:Ubiquitin-like domain-containing protein n=1 Tax=Adineta ricciae TaxID=249248 RepID=A0A815FYJ9_ADIRI|nr:unnamed protein product [Adineta ricciae]CAF1583810.1 unnamed protein product [Adineta ricciae]
MNDQTPRKNELPPTKASGNHLYTKLQVHFGGDVQDIVLKSEKEPTCNELGQVLQEVFRIPLAEQLVYFRGQRLHHNNSSAGNRPLTRYGIFSGNTIILVGKRGLL